MKPRLRYSPALRAWCCFGNGIRACASSPKMAYAVWNLRNSEAELRDALCAMKVHA